LGSIIFGLATPSEAAAMGSLGALLLAVGYGADYSRRWNVILVQTYGLLVAAFFIYLIVCGMTDLNVDRRVVTVALFATLLVGIALIPGTSFNVDPLFFGLLVALNIQTSFLSPPVAMAPFYLKGVAPSWVNINDIFRGVMPFMIIVIISMIMLYTFPQIGLWLPNQLYR